MSTKINAIVDGDGLPIRLALTSGQASDKEAAVPLIESLRRTRDLVADRGYDAKALIELAQSRNVCAPIPTQRDRKMQCSVDRNIYRQRNLVERFFNKLKHFRRVRPASTSSPEIFSLLSRSLPLGCGQAVDQIL